MLTSALQSVADACRVARRVQQSPDAVRELTKDDRSPVTVADFAVQAIVSMALDESTPIVGEERADLLRDPAQSALLDAVVEAVRRVHPDAGPDDVLAAIDRCDHDATASAYWALDPVDGTKGFLRGQQYAIALGLIEGGVVTLGVMGCPNLPAGLDRPLDTADPVGVMYSAAVGRGAWAHDVALENDPHAIATTSFDGDRAVRVCESAESAHSKQADTARIIEALGHAGEPVRLDSQCKYAVVARGQADAYLRMPTRKDYVEKIWDHAAGCLIATEAGAIVSDVTGSPLDFTHGAQLEANRGVVCATAGLHERVVAQIARLELA